MCCFPRSLGASGILNLDRLNTQKVVILTSQQAQSLKRQVKIQMHSALAKHLIYNPPFIHLSSKS